MFLSYDPIPVVTIGLVQDPWKTLNIIKGLKVMISVVQTIHSILVLRQTYIYKDKYLTVHAGMQFRCSVQFVCFLSCSYIPVRRADLLGEQLLTEVKPCLKTTALLAKLSMLGVLTALLP